MKKYIILALLLAFSANTIHAQSSSMTDDQVMKYVVKEHERGTSNAQIVTKLMQQTALTFSQIRRVRNKYERQMKQGGIAGASEEIAGKDATRLRTNNGKRREDYNHVNKKAENYSNYRIKAKEDENFKRSYDENDAEFMDFQNEMDFIIPDSTLMTQAPSC